MWKANVFLGLSTAAIAIYVLVHSFGLTYMIAFGPGPGFAPRWLAIMLLCLSIGFIALNLRRRDEEYGFPISQEAAMRSAGLFLVLGAAIFLIEPLGFTIAMALFMIVVLKIFERRSWLFSLGVGTLSSLGVFGLFAIVFDVPLPRLIDQLI